jgi:DNA-binding transcriptional LysR family regulator
MTFLAHVERILAELESARGLLADATGTPRGRLKVAAARGLGARLLAPAVLAFLQRFPEIEITLDMTDRPVNLQEDGYDLAIHAGVLVDGAAMTKRLAADRQVLVAAPGYLKSHGVPVKPDDLAGHQCLALGDGVQWSFVAKGIETSVRVTSRFRSDDAEMLKLAAVQGYGVLKTTELQVHDEVKSGQLVRVLSSFEGPGNTAVWALYPSGRHVLPRMRVFLDFLAEWFRTSQATSSVEAPGRLVAVDGGPR